MAPRSDHYRFEQVGDSAWAAVATDAGAAVGNAGIAGLGDGSLVVDCGYTPAAARRPPRAAEELAVPSSASSSRTPTSTTTAAHRPSPTSRSSPPSGTRTTIVEVGPGRIAGFAGADGRLPGRTRRAGSRPSGSASRAARSPPRFPASSLPRPRRRSPASASSAPPSRSSAAPATPPATAVVWLPGRSVLFAADLIGVEQPPQPDARRSAGNWLVSPRPARRAPPRPRVRPDRARACGRARRPRAAARARELGVRRRVPAEHRCAAGEEGRMNEPVRVACVQAEPVILDRARDDGQARDADRRGEGERRAARRLPGDVRPRVPELRVGEVPRRLGRPAGEGRICAARARVDRRARPRLPTGSARSRASTRSGWSPA